VVVASSVWTSGVVVVGAYASGVVVASSVAIDGVVVDVVVSGLPKSHSTNFGVVSGNAGDGSETLRAGALRDSVSMRRRDGQTGLPVNLDTSHRGLRRLLQLVM